MQRWLYWLDEGKGSRLLKGVACLLAIVLFTVYLGYKRFQGVSQEAVFREAIVARELARGNGFSTTVKDPQAAAFLRERDRDFSFKESTLPELYAAPGYSILLSGWLLAATEKGREAIFQPPLPQARQITTPYRGDYFLLGVNLTGFLLLLGVIYWFTNRLLGKPYGLIATLGVLLSAGWWKELQLLNGSSWMALLFTLCGICLLTLASSTSRKRSLPVALVLGGMLGSLTLFDPFALILLPLFLGAIALQQKSGKLLFSLCILATFLLVTLPWFWRNISLTGNPLGLGWQEIAWRSGDPTASPEATMGTLTPELADISIRKSLNKGLTAWEDYLGRTLWTTGLLFAAFFMVSLLFRFRDANLDRWKYFLAGVLPLLALAQGLLTDGDPSRTMAVWTSPILFIIGTGFVGVLVTNRFNEGWQRTGIFSALLLVHSLPLWQDVLEPKRLPFSYPPYSPVIMSLLGSQVEPKMKRGYALMADLPAGTAWYANTTVWRQPTTYQDFYRLQANSPTGALLLTTHTLNRPYFSDLRKDTHPIESGVRTQWADIYSGLSDEKLPVTFPLNEVNPIGDSFFILANRDARR